MPTDANRLSLRELYLQAIRLEDDAERESFLNEACVNEPLLRSRVEGLLAARHDYQAKELLEKAAANMEIDKEILGVEGFLNSGDPSPGETHDFQDTSDSHPTLCSTAHSFLIDISDHPMIGHFKLLEEIGHGGMGTVYMAKQVEPVRRDVALKIIKPGMDTRDVIARFEAERQALAMMDHPNIAKVFDGGTTDGGRPYFVMELVRGVTITDFCEQQRLSLRDRLELFVDVCKAVQHAHQKGIIHRDLKPSNVLVTMHDHLPVVKVIDFGVAKALNQELTDKTLFTQFAQMIGTPLYMAPEQAQMSGLDIDTRSDIYSLGVILYELLTGTTPFDRDTLSKLGADEFRKLLNEQDPERPSVRASTLKAKDQTTIGDQRRLDTEGITKQLKRELDWIVMKALEKDRERRYETANAFAADVQRFLNDEPVEACPPSVFYRSRKLAHRHQTAMAAILFVMVTLCVATATSSYWAFTAQKAIRELNRQKRVAVEAAAKAETNERKAIRLAYSADIKLAARSLQDGDIRRMSDLLERYPDPSSSNDLRGLEWWYLKQFSAASSQTILADDSGKTIVRFSPANRHIVVGQDDGALQFLDRRSLKPIKELQTQHGFVRGLDFSPDGNTLATTGDDGMIRLWDIAQRQEILSFRAHEKHSFRVFYIGDGKQLISCGEESDARLWEASTGRQLESLRNYSHGVEMAAMDVSSDRTRCTFLNAQGTVNVLDVATQKSICQLSHGQHPKRICRALCARFSPDDKSIAVGTDTNMVYVCNATTGETIRTFAGHNDSIQCLAFHPSGEVLVSGDKRGVVRTWLLADSNAASDAGGGKSEHWDPFFQAHSSRIWSATFTPDGKQLLTASRDGTLKSWSERDELQLKIENAQNACSVAFDGPTTNLVIASNSGAKRWKSDSRSLSDFGAKSLEQTYCVAVAPDSQHCVTGHAGGIIRLWNLSTQKLEHVNRGHLDFIVEMAISGDGELLATGSWDGTAKLWNLTDLSEIACIDLKLPHCYSIAISPDNRMLCCATESLAILFDIRTLRAKHVLKGHQDSVRSVAFSRDGTLLATGSADRTIRLWDPSSGAQLHTMPAHPDAINEVVFTPDGRTLIGGDKSGFISFSDVDTGDFLFQRRILEREIVDLAINEDGSHLALAVRNEPTMLLRLRPSWSKNTRGESTRSFELGPSN